eukprot:2315019-Rhodomonas_salina.1
MHLSIHLGDRKSTGQIISKREEARVQTPKTGGREANLGDVEEVDAVLEVGDVLEPAQPARDERD